MQWGDDPRFLASVSGWMVVPVTGRGIEEESTVWAEESEFHFGCTQFEMPMGQLVKCPVNSLISESRYLGREKLS